jgi:hypothetical protein
MRAIAIPASVMVKRIKFPVGGGRRPETGDPHQASSLERRYEGIFLKFCVGKVK